MYLVKEIDLNWTFYYEIFHEVLTKNAQNDQRDHMIVQ